MEARYSMGWGVEEGVMTKNMRSQIEYAATKGGQIKRKSINKP